MSDEDYIFIHQRRADNVAVFRRDIVFGRKALLARQSNPLLTLKISFHGVDCDD